MEPDDNDNLKESVNMQGNLDWDRSYEIAQILKINPKYIKKEKECYVVNGHKELKIKIFSHETKKYPLFFYQCIFDCHIGLAETFEDEAKYYPNFQECDFLKQTYWWGKDCVDKLVFRKCFFKEQIKVEANFQKDLIFERCVFQDSVIFRGCTFKEKVSFYGSEFEKFPIFSQSFFKEDLNLVNTKLDSNYQEIIEEIEKNKENKYSDFTINDFRDSFRIIKNSLIKNNSIIDASNYHRIELYFRELELEFEDPAIFSRDWIDKWQLWFYRLTSDHHTDLAKIFSNVILLIALFGVFSLCLNEIKTAIPIDNSVVIQSSDEEAIKKWQWGIFQALASNIDRGVIFILLSLSGFFCFLHIIEKILNLKNFFQENRIKKILSMLGYLVLSVVFICVGAYVSLRVSFFSSPLFEAYTIALICLNFVFVYLVLVLTRGYALTFLSSIICFGILIFKPSLLLPFVGQLFSEGIIANFPAMQSLSVVYCILMFLMLFSLQKTARKNSIIPS